MAGLKKVAQNEVLFKEGEASESMFVIKKGRLSIFKPKGQSEIELAVVGAGQMVGEMAFFDRKPRSASAKAITDTEVIELPFKNLQAQFDALPEWIKSMVKTINDHLREANKRIKNLEQTQNASPGKAGMTPHQANKCCGILALVATKYGEPDPAGGIDLKPGILRKFTIQVFQEPTTRMGNLMMILQGMGLLKQEDLGEGKQKITILQLPVIVEFVEWFNELLYKEASKRVVVDEGELKPLSALIHFGKKLQPDEKGKTKISLTQIQNESMKELGFLATPNNFDMMIKKGVMGDKSSEKDGSISTLVDMKELERVFPFWQIVYALGGLGD